MPQPTTRTRTNTRRLPLPASGLEALLLLHMAAAGLPVPEQQVRFHPTRRWRFDFAWPNANGHGGIAVEVDGGTWTGGRHVSGSGYEADCVKINEAQKLGWVVLRFTRAMIDDGRAVATIEEMLRRRDGMGSGLVTRRQLGAKSMGA